MHDFVIHALFLIWVCGGVICLIGGLIMAFYDNELDPFPILIFCAIWPVFFMINMFWPLLALVTRIESLWRYLARRFTLEKSAKKAESEKLEP